MKRDVTTTVLGAASLLGLAVVLGLSLTSPLDVNQGSLVRLMFVHVPEAWLSYLAYGGTGLFGLLYLIQRRRHWDRLAMASGEIGLLFTLATIVGGMLWAKPTWGTYWVWDARLTSTAFLFITYIGYLAVRRLGGTLRQRARRSSVLALLAVLEIPLVHFSVTLWRSLHQDASVADPNAKVQMDGLMLFTLFLGLFAFTALFVWMVLHRQRVILLEDTVADRGLDAAIADRRHEVTK